MHWWMRRLPCRQCETVCTRTFSRAVGTPLYNTFQSKLPMRTAMSQTNPLPDTLARTHPRERTPARPPAAATARPGPFAQQCPWGMRACVHL